MALVVKRRPSGKKLESHESVASFSPEVSSKATGNSASTAIAQEKEEK